MYKVLIAEDHALIRFGFKTAVESRDFIDKIYEASTGEEAIDIAAKNPVDIVIMDLGLPGINGIEASKKILSLKKDVKIIILTSHNNEQEVLDSIGAGARAFCSKEISPNKLADIILSVMEGALWFDPKVSDIILNAINKEKSKKFEADEIYNLTDREKDVLEYICEGLNNGEISKILDVSVNTVKVHVSSIIQKLGVEDRTQVVVKAFKSFIK